MHKTAFISIFNQSIAFLSEDWKNQYSALLSKEHWDVIRKRVFSFAFENRICHSPLPFFNDEVTVAYPEHYIFFESVKSISEKNRNEGTRLIAAIIEETPIESLLIILGQRKTSATIANESGIPPEKELLLKSSFEPYNNQMCKATRARDKHIARSSKSSFWGKTEGTPVEKEEATKALVKKIIEKKTWWNVFTHYKHGVVYEIRVASGEGIRWRKRDLDLIGFLEPFI